MTHRKSFGALLMLSAVFATSSLSGCRTSQGSEHGALKEEQGGGSAHSHWNYQVQEQWPGVCQTGARQSPITLDPQYFPSASRGAELRLAYADAVDVNVLDNSHTIEVAVSDDVADAGGITIGDRFYKLAQFHFHMPAEHVRAGEKPSDMEVHFVHKYTSPEGQTTAIALGFFLRADGADTRDPGMKALGAIFDEVESDCGLKLTPDGRFHCKPRLGTISNENDIESNDDIVDSPVIAKMRIPIRALISTLTKGNQFVSYEGSLTTPACNEIVTHVVGMKDVTVPGEIGRIFHLTGYEFTARHVVSTRFPEDQGIRQYQAPKVSW